MTNEEGKPADIHMDEGTKVKYSPWDDLKGLIDVYFDEANNTRLAVNEARRVNPAISEGELDEIIRQIKNSRSHV